MTRLELLTIAVGRARSNGFELRRWYTGRLGLPWISAEAALTLLETQRRYYALLFSHEFACAFWKAGEEITFSVPAGSFKRRLADGTIATVQRKGFIRRSGRRDAWLWHLRQMAAAEEPLRYILKYLQVEDDLEDEKQAALAEEAAVTSPFKTKTAAKTIAKTDRRMTPIKRSLPTDTPAFLQRSYDPKR
jgi:hypothetical protein